LKISKIGKSRAFVLLAMAVVLVFALHSALYAASVPCVPVPGNPTDMVEFRQEDPTTMTYMWGDATVEITVYETDEGWFFDFDSDTPVSLAVAKGGSEGACAYYYDPPVMSDTGLHASMNPSEKYAGLSWIGFNFEEEQPPGDDDDEEPPGDDDDEQPPGDDDDDEVQPPGEEEQEEAEEEEFLPFTEEEEEESLPFTGGELVVLLGAGLAATTGITLRRIGR